MLDPLLVNKRVLWLQQAMPSDGIKERVESKLREAGFQVSTANLLTKRHIDLDKVDVILVDGFERLDAILESTLARVRIESQAPLIVLTSRQSTEETIMALTAGADAIWSLETPIELLIVRIKTLLRRWIQSP